MLTVLLVVLALASIGLGVYLSLDFRPEIRDEKTGRKTQEEGFAGVKFNLLSLIPGVAGVLLFILTLSIVTVDAGNRGILKRFGRVAGNLEPGIHLVRPVGDTVTSFPVQSRIVKPNEDAATKDTQVVHFEVTFRYHIEPEYADYILIQDNGDPESRVINPAILEAIKSATSQYTIQDLIGKRPQVRDDIDALISKTLQGTHIVPEAVAITDFAFSKEYESAIEAKQIAQQKAEQATNDLQRIEVEAKQAKAKADGQAQAAISAANGEAQSTLVTAKAKAEAQRLMKENITSELLQLKTLEVLDHHWTGDFPTTFLGGGSNLNPANMLFQMPSTPRREKKPE